MSVLSEWFAMSGYALYIWSAYGLVVLALGIVLFGAHRQQKRVRRRLCAWFTRLSA